MRLSLFLLYNIGMTFENQIITEKYIIKLRQISNYCNNTYIKNRFKLIVKYMVGNNLFDNIPLCNSYFTEIDQDIRDEVPFVVKTDLYTELTYLDNINQGGLLKIIRDLQKEYSKELSDEADIRKTLDEGQLYERNQQMIDAFIKEYGYDPIDKQTFISHNQDEDDDEENSSNFLNLKNKDITDYNTTQQQDPNPQQSQQLQQPQLSEQTQPPQQQTEKQIQNGNCSLESLNQILDIVDFNFDEIINDIIKEESQTKKESKAEVEEPETKPKKKRMTKKEKEEQMAKEEAEQAKKNVKDNGLEVIIHNFSKLKNNKRDDKKNNDEEIKNGIEAGIKIAKYYHMGEVLQKSHIKGNLIYVYLIKKFNHPESMYLLGEELLNGITIQKNHKQGAKLIKVAAESFYFAKAITKLKTLIKAC